MLELHILEYIILKDGRSYVSEGQSPSFRISHIMREHNIPKATFYRSIKTLINQGFIVRRCQGFYSLSNTFRVSCNAVKKMESVS